MGDELIQALNIAASLNETAHGKDRRRYQYDRSALVTAQRFAKEFEAFDAIVGKVGELVELYASDKTECCISFGVDRANPPELSELKALLGKFRLYIDYRDDSGNSFCSVRTRAPDRAVVRVSKSSPYARCKDICRMIEFGCKADCVNEHYDELIRCVDCRWHAIETGTRDRRRLNRRKNKRFGIAWERDYWSKYDAECSREK